MLFDTFVEIREKLQKMPLPGQEAHALQLANREISRLVALRNDPSPKLSGVAAIVYPENQEAGVFLIERQTYKGAHSGQIGFPGGKKEIQDPNLEFTAKRESEEEIGVKIGDLDFVKELTEVYIPPSRFLVKPFIFIASEFPSITLQEREVKSLIKLPLKDLLDDEIQKFGTVSFGEGMRIKTPYFDVDGHKVWGATAMMLSEMKMLLNEARL